MNNTYKILIGWILMIFLFGSCSDEFLEENPKGSVSGETLATESGVRELLIGAYSLLDGFELFINNMGAATTPSNWMFGDVPSDDMHRGDNPGGWGEISIIERFETTSTNSFVGQVWELGYDGVSRANDVLRILELAREKNAISQDAAMQIEAEARWLRAWYHFQMRLKFEKIPYIKHDIDDPTQIKNNREVWDDMEADIQWGIDNNMDEYPVEPGRISYFAAETLLARIHLMQLEYLEAKPLLQDVIDRGGYSLTSHFYDNFDEERQNNEESIFEIQYSVNDASTYWNSTVGSGLMAPNGIGLCCSYSAPSFDLFNAFKVDADGLPLLDTYQDNFLIEDYGLLSTDPFVPTGHLLDPRVDWTIGRRGITYLDWGAFTGSDMMNNQLEMGPFLNKKIIFYKRNNGNINTTNLWEPANANNWRMFRLGHVILWRAEVAVEENDLETARQLVNQIRTRAADDIVMGRVSTPDDTFGGSEDDIIIDTTQAAANYDLQPYPVFPNQDYARKAVRHEMRLEFALEGIRFFDLVRWGEAARVINDYLELELANNKLPWLQGTRFVEGKNEYNPIPQLQLDLQKGILEQDPDHQ